MTHLKGAQSRFGMSAAQAAIANIGMNAAPANMEKKPQETNSRLMFKATSRDVRLHLGQRRKVERCRRLVLVVVGLKRKPEDLQGHKNYEGKNEKLS